MLTRRFCALLMASHVIFCFLSAPAWGAGVDEKQISASLALAVRGSLRSGVQASIEAAMGLSDSWAARGGASFVWLPKQASAGADRVTTLSLGATYSFDVLRWVPFLDLGISLADRRGDGVSVQSLGPEAGLGVEFLLSRRWTLALLARFDYLALRLHGPGGSSPWLGCAGLRLGRVF
jgi:hypothetical protein